MIAALISEGAFREDLFHRLSVVPIRVPSLSERREDIPELISFFMDQMASSSGMPPRRIAADAMAILQSHDWPGNIRQLRNNVERLMILTKADPETEITADLLPSEVGALVPATPTGTGGEKLMSLPLRDAREVFEREYLMAQSAGSATNISRTAEFIGMERSAFTASSSRSGSIRLRDQPSQNGRSFLAAPGGPARHPLGSVHRLFEDRRAWLGGVAAWARHVLVIERGWMSQREFAELFGLASTLPGANTVNMATMLGDRVAGLTGVLAALAGLVGAPLLILIAIIVLYARFSDVPDVRAGLTGAAAATAGLVLGTAVKLLRGLEPDAVMFLAVAFVFAATALARLPILLVLGVTISILLDRSRMAEAAAGR